MCNVYKVPKQLSISDMAQGVISMCSDYASTDEAIVYQVNRIFKTLFKSDVEWDISCRLGIFKLTLWLKIEDDTHLIHSEEYGIHAR